MGVSAPIFMTISTTSQLIALVTACAQTLADSLGLEVVGVFYKTHTQPPTLRVDIRHREQPTGIDDCGQLSGLLEAQLETVDWFSGPYILEVSSPGIDRKLTTDREFTAFRGFPVRVTGYGLLNGQKIWEGTLLRRDESQLAITVQGRVVTFPLVEIASVQIIPHN